MLALLLGVACHRQAAPQAAAPRLEAETATDRVRVFLISPGDGGLAGPRVGCGDSAVPIEVRLDLPQPALSGALAALLAMHENYDRGSGLLNALYSSPLTLAGIERVFAYLAIEGVRRVQDAFILEFVLIRYALVKIGCLVIHLVRHGAFSLLHFPAGTAWLALPG